MIETDLGIIYFRDAIQNDFPRIIDLIKSSYAPHIIRRKKDDLHPVDINNPPFPWYGDPSLYWKVAEIDNNIVAFTLSRWVERNWHFHSICVNGGYQGKGIGKIVHLYRLYLGLKTNPELQSFTLHCRETAYWARKLVEKLGYKEIDQKLADPKEDSGLGDWVRRCKEFNNWPLRAGLVFYTMTKYDAIKLIDKNAKSIHIKDDKVIVL